MSFRKILFLFLFTICFSQISFSQGTRVWSTYYGDAFDDIGFVSADAAGNVYLCGSTFSSSGIASGGFQNTFGGGEDAFLVKFDALGNRIWGTYYGNSGPDAGLISTVDASGNIYLVGYTSSPSGIASGGFQNSYGGGTMDGMLVKFDAAGNRIWATYCGGSGDEYIENVITDASGNVYVTGWTNSTTGISSGGFQNSFGGNYDAFLIKFNSSGNRLWGTYYGNIGYEAGACVSIDPRGNIYMAGRTKSSSGISSGGFQNTIGGVDDAFLVKFDSLGNRIWATYYGGTNTDLGYSVSADASGNAYLAGYTNSPSAIASGGFQNTFGGAYDSFLAKFDSSGNRVWATYYGGFSAEELKQGCTAIDEDGNIYLAGDTYSPAGISSGGFQDSLVGQENQFLVKFDPNGNRLCSTYYGQVHDEEGGVAVDGSGNVFLSGQTHSTTGIASGGFQNTFGGGNYDAYLVKFTTCTLTDVKPEEKNESNISVFPNPSNGTFQVYSEEKISEIKIYDMLGEVIYSEMVGANKSKIDIHDLANGIYFIKFIIGEGTVTKKVIKQ